LGFALHVVWFFLLLPVFVIDHLLPGIVRPKENTERLQAIESFVPGFEDPAIFEEDLRFQNLRFLLVSQPNDVDEEVKVVFFRYEYFTEEEAGRLSEVLERYYLSLGREWEAREHYALARRYFWRGFTVAHPLAAQRRMIDDYRVQRRLSELRLRSAFYRRHLPFLDGEVTDSLFVYKGERLCGMTTEDLDMALSNAEYDPYESSMKYGLALALYREVKPSYFWRSYDEMDSEDRDRAFACVAKVKDVLHVIMKKPGGELREEAQFLLAKSLRMEKSIAEAEFQYLRLIQSWPESYLADDAVLSLYKMCAGEAACHNGAEIYQDWLLKRYKDRDATRFFD